jgi:beta propeller repeat protein
MYYGRFKGASARVGCCLLPLVLTHLITAIPASAAEYAVKQISDNERLYRDPVISSTGLAAWSGYSTNATTPGSDIFVYRGSQAENLTESQAAKLRDSVKPCVESNQIVWVAGCPGFAEDPYWTLREVPRDTNDIAEIDSRHAIRFSEQGYSIEPVAGTNEESSSAGTNAPGALSSSTRQTSGETEIMQWSTDSEIRRLTRDYSADFAPSAWGDLVAYQKAKGWPFGWEIMIWQGGEHFQLTTNYYYDLAPKVQGDNVVWYGWDGHDFEIYLYDRKGPSITQITSNQYDDVSPSVWDGTVVWEGYAAVESDIFLWKEGTTTKISDNIEDDLNARIWNGQVVWQGFDGDDFEIYFYDGTKTTKLTSNLYDDTNPDIRDGIICWMGHFENWDAEIFVWDGGPNPVQVTDNDEEDRDPSTAGKRVVWHRDAAGRSVIFLAEPK